MNKFYVQNGDTKITIMDETEADAAMHVIARICRKCKPIALTTYVSDRGYIEDLLDEDMLDKTMSDSFDQGTLFLTSAILIALAKNCTDPELEEEYYAICEGVVMEEEYAVEENPKLSRVLLDLSEIEMNA